MREFQEKVSGEYRNYRDNFRDSYTYIENYGRNKYKSGNYLNFVAKTTNATEICQNEIAEIIRLDYIKSNANNFNVRPKVKNSTDFLRKEILKKNEQHNYNKSLERALYELLQTIRDNITHYGKFEVSENQYERNFVLIKNASIIANNIVKQIEKLEKE